MSTQRVHTSRRTTLALALSAPIALAACDLDPPSASPSADPSDPATPAPPPDAEVVSSARAAIVAAVALAEAAQARYPRLALADLLAVHAAHLAVLDDGSPAPQAAAPIVENTLALAREQVTTTENGLAATLGAAAGQAASGDLARALASMSAALLQRTAR